MLLTLFIGLIVLIVWTIVIFPISFIVFAKLLKKKALFNQQVDFTPSVDIIVAAFNEAHNLPDKIATTLSQNYPADKWRLIIASDGSTDNTVEIMKQYEDSRIVFLDLPRQGKMSVLNETMNHIQHEVVIYSDADTTWHPDLIREIVKPMSNEQIATVGGKIVVEGANKNVGFGDTIYRKYEDMLRKAENKLLATVSFDGGIFAIRKTYVCELPTDVADDFYLCTHAPCYGKSLYFQDTAIVYDKALEKPNKQFNRRVRLTVQGLTGLWRRRELLNPKRGWYAYSLFNHKVLRRLVPPAILLLLPINLLIMFKSPWLMLLALAQLLIYGMAIVGFIFKNGQLPNIFYLVTHLVVNFIAGSWAIVKFIKGDRIHFWDPSVNRTQ